MSSSGGHLLFGVTLTICWLSVTGIRYLPEEALQFAQCSPSGQDCPTHSSCEETNHGYYCGCDDKYYNTRDRLTFTYPGGQCDVEPAFCDKSGSISVCPCRRGFIMIRKKNNAYVCINKCAENSHCPANAECVNGPCKCLTGWCNSLYKQQCYTNVTIDGECIEQNTTTPSVQTTPHVETSTALQHKPDAETSQMTTSDLSNVTTPSVQTTPRVETSTALKHTPVTPTSKMTSGTRYLPDEALYFPKCSPSGQDCPTHSSCVKTNHGYYCGCDNGYYNTRDRLTITYPGGECDVEPNFCDKRGSISLCSCRRGFVKIRRENNLYFCTNKCEEDSHCPADAECVNGTCKCLNGMCNAFYKQKCRPDVAVDGECKGNTRCQPSSSKELEECIKSKRQDSFCSLLRETARIHNRSCTKNETIIPVKQVAQNFATLLNHTTLINLTTSEVRSAVNSILRDVETSVLQSFSRNPQNQTISTPELEVQLKATGDVCSRLGASAFVTLTVLDSTMQVPCTHVSGQSDGALLISYKDLQSKVNGSLLDALGESDQEDRREINSPIVSGAITKHNVQHLDPPVSFHLRLLKDVPPSFTVECMYWDTEQKVWSSDGCETKKSDRINSTLCVCSHLSSFAVIMATHDFQDHEGLLLISRFGLTVSLTCLFLSLLTFLLCRALRSAHTSVLTALCGCLFVGQLLVLVGLRLTDNKVLCGVIAGALQLSFLCAFCWMSLESMLLFLTVRNLRAVNYMTSQRSHFPYVCLLGFGIPVIIVIISAAIKPHAYGTENYCWLKRDLIWSFLGPVCVFITINLILLVLTFGLLRQKLASLNSNVSTLKHTRLLTFKALSQLFILGCTWIFGYFQFGSAALVMSFLFTICNSLQGLYIFVVHCMLNRQVREEYRRMYRRLHAKRSDSEAISGSTVPMTTKSSQVSEVPRIDWEGSKSTTNTA